jgi:predicted RNA-binding Zn-ribbon protein involved in translation (DUF1610 family)
VFDPSQDPERRHAGIVRRDVRPWWCATCGRVEGTLERCPTCGETALIRIVDAPEMPEPQRVQLSERVKCREPF